MPLQLRGVPFSRDGVPRWRVAVVRGESMLPLLRPGDRLLLSHRRPVAPGRVVVATFADGTVAVKRAVERRTTASGAPGWWLVSDEPSRGVDSRHRGPVPDERVHGVVLGRVWPWPRLLGGPLRRRVRPAVTD
ncbi:S24/S26 family peptidase [Nocardioides sp.]|uniref:S24/S26 family peptidase n=1 Tax=Nocardioides sp. TaxID=35761 RepID=UPI00356AAF11